MGNVCCKWDVSYIASQLASSLEEKDYIIKHLFQTKQWAQLDQGVLSLQDAKKQTNRSGRSPRTLLGARSDRDDGTGGPP